MSEEVKKTCEGCGAKCCREANVWLEEPKTEEDFDEWKWLLSHKSLYIYNDPRYGWMICFETECKFLDKESKCVNYENRPNLCKEYGLKDCIKYDNLKIEPILRNPEDVDELKKELQKK